MNKINIPQKDSSANRSYENVDLRKLPKYICYKAALLKEKLTLQYVILILSFLFSVYFITSRIEIMQLHNKLREKEYILAPGVVDFTTVSPQSVSDKYVNDAVMSFLSLLGNINATNIDDQYRRIAEMMKPELRIQFEVEVASWRETVKKEKISEILKILQKEIISDSDGFYKVKAQTRRDRFSNNEYMGSSDETVEMVLELIPPKRGKEWFLQINSLVRNMDKK